MVRLDLPTWLLIFHGTFLVAAGRVLHERWAVGLIALFGAWRIGFQAVQNRAAANALARLSLGKIAGSLLLVSALTVADGGSDSPFFYWTLLLLAYNALVTSSARLLAMSGVAVAGFVGMMAATTGLTVGSLGRLGLLISFCAVLEIGRLRIEHHEQAVERAQRDRERFLITASHQIRTPLTPIIGYAEMLLNDDLVVEDQHAAADEILTAARAMERLFERIASVMRLRATATHDLTTVSVETVLDHVRGQHPELVDGVIYDGDYGAVLECRPESVASAVSELLDNGHRFGRPPVRMSWARVNGHVEFAISDSGDGPEEHLTAEQLFGFWGEAASEDAMPVDGATNLGLLRTRLLAELNGGSLDLHRDPEEWAFVLRLRAARF